MMQERYNLPQPSTLRTLADIGSLWDAEVETNDEEELNDLAAFLEFLGETVKPLTKESVAALKRMYADMYDEDGRSEDSTRDFYNAAAAGIKVLEILLHLRHDLV